MRLEDHTRLFVFQEKPFVFPTPAAVGRFHDADAANGCRGDAFGEAERPVLVDVAFARSRVVGQGFGVVFVVVHGVQGAARGVAGVLIHGFKPDGPMQAGLSFWRIFRHCRRYVRGSGIAERLVGVAAAGELEFAGFAPHGVFAVFAGENAEGVAHPGFGHVAVHEVVEAEGVGLDKAEFGLPGSGGRAFRRAGGLAGGEQKKGQEGEKRFVIHRIQFLNGWGDSVFYLRSNSDISNIASTNLSISTSVVAIPGVTLIPLIFSLSAVAT